MKPYKLASREFHEEDTVVEVGGGKVPSVKIGACSRNQISSALSSLRQAVKVCMARQVDS